MGCSAIKDNVVIEVSYCGGCGWSIPAKKVCDAIIKKMPKSTVDCKPEESYTGVMKISLVIDKK